MPIASNSTSINTILPSVVDGTLNLGAIILSAFFGGFFAGTWTNFFESKRRIADKRTDKYYEHRNTVVQIEQELIPLRVNISRNITSIADAINNTNENNIRFVLRFYKLYSSTGLGLKLLSLDLINKYAQLYSAIETFNSDIQHVSGIVESVRENNLVGKVDHSLVDSYKVFLPHLKNECEEIDQKSLELLAIIKVAINKGDKKIKDKYLKDGEEIKYRISDYSLTEKYEEITKEEDPSFHKGEKRPKFISPFLDLKKVIVRSSPTA